MDFESWSKDCEELECPARECSDDWCPRYDDFIADLEAHEYQSFLESKLDKRREKEVGL